VTARKDIIYICIFRVLFLILLVFIFVWAVLGLHSQGNWALQVFDVVIAIRPGFPWLNLHEFCILSMHFKRLLSEYHLDHLLSVFATKAAARFVSVTLLSLIYIIHKVLDIFLKYLFLGRP
jgi:hypothetical protein